jgi:hypothetical protein
VNDIITQGSIIVTGDDVSNLNNDLNLVSAGDDISLFNNDSDFRTGGQVTTTANAARDTARDNLAQNLGWSNYSSMVSDALAEGTTLITGGVVRTSLINAGAVFAEVGSFSHTLQLASGAEFVNSGNTLFMNNARFAFGSSASSQTLTSGTGMYANTSGHFRAGATSGGSLTEGFQWNGTNFTFESANTSLDSSGNLTATNANITGSVTAESFTAESGDLEANFTSTGFRYLFDSIERVRDRYREFDLTTGTSETLFTENRASRAVAHRLEMIARQPDGGGFFYRESVLAYRTDGSGDIIGGTFTDTTTYTQSAGWGGSDPTLNVGAGDIVRVTNNGDRTATFTLFIHALNTN